MLQHKGTVILETERLILRPFTMEDVQPMSHNWASDPEVAKYLTWTAHTNEEETKFIVRSWVEEYARLDSYQWAIELKSLGQPIGSIAVIQVDESADMCEVGYCIGKTWWHQGIMTEALHRVMQFLFDEVKAKRICAKHATENPNSGKVMKKCGMKYEGTWENAGKTGLGEICDLAVYSITRE